MKLRHIAPLAIAASAAAIGLDRSPRPTPTCSIARAMPKSLLLPGKPHSRPPKAKCHSAGTRLPCYFTAMV